MRAVRFFFSLLQSPASYPLLTMWLISGGAFSAWASGYLEVGTVFLIMTCSLIVLILVAFRKDLAAVHDLVNSTNDRMVNRITQLTTAIEKSGNVVPPEPHISQERSDDNP